MPVSISKLLDCDLKTYLISSTGLYWWVSLCYLMIKKSLKSPVCSHSSSTFWNIRQTLHMHVSVKISNYAMSLGSNCIKQLNLAGFVLEKYLLGQTTLSFSSSWEISRSLSRVAETSHKSWHFVLGKSKFAPGVAEHLNGQTGISFSTTTHNGTLVILKPVSQETV